MKRRWPILIAGLAILMALGGWLGSWLWAQRENIFLSLRTFEHVLHLILRKYVREVESLRVIEAGIDGMLRSLDPQSQYLNPKEYSELRLHTEGEFGGLGIQIDLVDGVLTIISPIEGTPAYRAGLKPGDRIVKIEERSTEGITLEEAVSTLRGPPGTRVRITIQREGVEELKEYTITREIIKIRAVLYAGLIAPEIGYLRLAAFSRTARPELASAIDSLFKLGARKLILDLQGNSGGLLREGIEVADLFLPPGRVVVKTRGRLPEANQEFRAREEPLHGDYPLVVLTDGGSASASEIVAGAIQDWDRGLILGDTTYGKGSVQTLYPLEGGGALKLTTAYWYTPSGRCIDRVIKEDPLTRAQFIREERYFSLGERRREVFGEGGIVPDVVIEPPKLSAFERKLDREYFFEFAGRYAKPGLKRDFSVTPEMFREFKTLLREKGVEFTEAQFDSSLRFIEQRIKQEIAGRLWGDRGRYEVGIFPYDPQLARAVELLTQVDSTPDLFRLAAQ